MDKITIFFSNRDDFLCIELSILLMPCFLISVARKFVTLPRTFGSKKMGGLCSLAKENPTEARKALSGESD
jgi:hypothetical protein